MIWVEWQDQESFNLWHNSLCLQLGYPLIPVNQATGLPDKTAQKTTAYTNAIKVNNKVIALVESKYADELIPTELRPQIKALELA